MAKLSLLHYLKKGVFASSVHFDRFLSDHYFPSIGLSAEEPFPPANPIAGSDRVPHMFVTATKLANDVHVPFNEFLVCNYPRPWDADGESGSSDWPAADAVKATAAASPYFPPVVRDGDTFVDGGFSISNRRSSPCRRRSASGRAARSSRRLPAAGAPSRARRPPSRATASKSQTS